MTDQLPSVSVGALLRERGDPPGIELELLAGGSGLDRLITNPYVQKTGLALSGFDQYLQPGRILVFGDSEVQYLEQLDAPARQRAICSVLARGLPCLLITENLPPPAGLAPEADLAGVPLLRTSHSTPSAIGRLTAMLEERLAPRQVIHGVLVDVLGLGVLIGGESGIGKSECALDLVVRGHRLVADDTVEVRRRGGAVILGACPALTRDHMEVRGLGIVDVKELFGVASTRPSKRIELVVMLERWEAGRDYDRLGLDESYHEILGQKIPMIQMPVAPGRNLATLVEVAARNHLLKSRGRHAARQFVRRHERALQQSSPEAGGRTDGDDEP